MLRHRLPELALPPCARRLWATVGAAAILLSGVFAQQLSAVDGMTYEQEVASLRAMVDEPRDTEIYELDFHPMSFDRILVRDRLGENQVFHYLTFRLRNRVSDNADFLAQHASVYNEVLDNMVREYGFLRKVTEGGASLVVDDIRELEDESMAVILERQSLRVRTRKVSMTVIAFDEHGTRFRLFDPVPGEGPQENFNFPDRGLTVANGNFYQRIREAIEERYRQRLYTTREIRQLEMPPYDASRPSTYDDGYGMAQGEIFGVLIFDRLNVHGNHFTFHIHGLSNKQRFQWPEQLPQGRVEDYFNLRVLRRVYSMEVTRPGDEFNRDRNHFVMRSSGWRWVERFLRLEQRRAIAYSRFHRHNISLPQEQVRDGVLHDSRVASAFWTHYNRIRSNWGQRYAQKLDEHAAHQQTVLAPYAAPEDTQRVTDEELQRLQDERQAWEAVLERHRNTMRERADNLGSTLPDWQATTQERR